MLKYIIVYCKFYYSMTFSLIANALGFITDSLDLVLVIKYIETHLLHMYNQLPCLNSSQTFPISLDLAYLTKWSR
jgi:hypothetical protein